MDRIKWIDAAKGIAIVMVVVGHVVQSYHNVGFYEDSILFNFSSQFVYSFHMALFMILSGMLIGKKLEASKDTVRGGVRDK